MKSNYICLVLCVFLLGFTLVAKANMPNQFQDLKEKKESGRNQVRPAGTSVSQNKGDRSLNSRGGGIVAQSSRNIQLFFPRDGFQNPRRTVPNWYFYWSDGNVVDRLPQFNFDATDSSYGYYNSITKELYVGSAAVTTDQTYNVSHKWETYTASFPGNQGIDLCAMTLVHELKHKSLAETLPNYNKSGQPNALDSDGDGLPDLYETSLPYHLYITDSDTYNLASIDPSYASYGDEEFLCRKAEANPPTVRHSQDWSDTNGYNWLRARMANQAVMVLGGNSTEEDPLDDNQTLEELLKLLPTVTPKRQVAIIQLLGQRAETGALDALIRLYHKQPISMGMDYRPMVKIEIIRAASEIGGRDAKQFLMSIVDNYWTQGPQCHCARCGEERLYPHHDGDYSSCFATALTALQRWISDEDVRFVYEKISEDIKGVRLGRIRVIAYGCLLEKRMEQHSRLTDEGTRLRNLIDELATVGVCKPDEKYVLENNVGKMSWKNVQNKAIESIILKLDDSHATELEKSLLSKQSMDASKRAAIKFAVNVMNRKRIFREANRGSSSPPSSP